jgi:hypothetical protein
MREIWRLLAVKTFHNFRVLGRVRGSFKVPYHQFRLLRCRRGSFGT